jgi:hypothetical protein
LLERGSWYYPATISTMLSDEYGENGRVKALATLDQLTKKKLIIKQLISNKDRGNVAVFYPREWGENAFCQWSAEKIAFLKEKAGIPLDENLSWGTK